MRPSESHNLSAQQNGHKGSRLESNFPTWPVFLGYISLAETEDIDSMPASTGTTTVLPVQTAQQTTNYRAMAMVTTLFFMWGFLTCLNDILIPHLKSIFDLNYAKVMLIQFSFFSAYFFFSIPSGKVIEWIGYKKTMVVGLFTMAIGALLFIPAASVPSFPLFLTALMILATGITALQVAANPYVAVLGTPRTASSRLNLKHDYNS